MNVQEIGLKGFTSHDHTEVKLPERGLVLVTGENGSGKSSLMEGVAWACWGKTLRGSDPWRSHDEECVARVAFADREPIARARIKGKNALAWSETEYETTTKSQEALEKSIGSFDVWRRTHVFSSQDAAHFSLATDAERKRLLESILGLDRFDDALDACRTDVKTADADYQKSAVEHTRLATSHDEAKRRLKEHRVNQAAAGLVTVDVAALTADEARYLGLLKKIELELAAFQKSLAEVERSAGGSDYELRALEKKLKDYSEGYCPTCEQDIPKEWLERDREAFRIGREKIDADKQRIAEQSKDIRAQMEELREERTALHVKHTKASFELAQAASTKRLHDQLAASVNTARDDVGELVIKTANAAESARLAQVECATLRAVEQVLGLKGVRAHVLGRALKGVEAVANNWLIRIAGAGMSVSIKSYSEKKTGGVSDAISLEVVGAGGGRGYRAASGGERRRIDVALLLALADVASAARGVKPGTLFFDEVFDALDRSGIDAVSAVLSELAGDRAVMVVSHSDIVVNALEPDVRMRVDGGEVQLG